jgi:DNA polymerase-4
MSINTSVLPYNQAPARVMHIDLNSCFAIIEQQGNRLLRGKPVGVAAYDTPRGFILAASYEAKYKGIKLGVNVQQARELCPGIVIMCPDPAKYREAHRRFKELMLEYTSDVVPKSIDEFVLDLSGSPVLRMGMTMEEVGLEIKDKIRQRLGEAVTVNIGIGPNRFLAKYAAGFGKPDGMNTIDHTSLEKWYTGMDLVDLPGINVRYRRRLQMYNIMTPLDFLAADMRLLQKVVFQSIHGRHWYLRLRGYETDRYESKRGQIGHQYALPHKTWDREELARLLLKLCEKVGRRLRKEGLSAGGIHLYLSFVSYQEGSPRDNGFLGGENLNSKRAWHHGEKLPYRLYSTESVYRATKSLLDRAEIYNKVRGMAITTFNLEAVDPEQMNIFDPEGMGTKAQGITGTQEYKSFAAERRMSDALDAINNRYGEFVVTPATMMDMQGTILDRIAFGSVRDV